MRVAWILLALLGVAACASVPALSDAASHRERVQRDVEAITQGMNHARAQSEAVARARGL
jgi:hypothetical protein